MDISRDTIPYGFLNSFDNTNSETNISESNHTLISLENNHNHLKTHRKITQVDTNIITREDQLKAIKSQIEQLCKEKTAVDFSFTGEYSCYVMYSIDKGLNIKTLKEWLQIKQKPYIICVDNFGRLNKSERFKEYMNIVCRDIKEEEINYLLLAINYDADINLIIELLKHGVNPNTYSEVIQESPLTMAVDRGKINVVKTLLEFKADPNFVGPYCRSYISLANAIDKKNNEIIELLIKYGATANVEVTSNFYTPLVQAIKHNNEYMVKKLITLGANVDGCVIDDAETPLYYAALFNYLRIAKILLEYGANPNQRCDQNSALLRLILTDNMKGVKLFVEYGVKINIKQHLIYLLCTEQVPLIFAIRCKKRNIIKELLKYGADPNIKHEGKTALQWAIIKNDFKTAHILRRNLASASSDAIEKIINNFGADPLGEVSLYERACITIRRHYNITNISDWPLPKNRKIDLQEYDI